MAEDILLEFTADVKSCEMKNGRAVAQYWVNLVFGERRNITVSVPVDVADNSPVRDLEQHALASAHALLAKAAGLSIEVLSERLAQARREEQ